MATESTTQSVSIRGLSKEAEQYIRQQAKAARMSCNQYMQMKLSLIAEGHLRANRDRLEELSQIASARLQTNSQLRDLLHAYFPELAFVHAWNSQEEMNGYEGD